MLTETVKGLAEVSALAFEFIGISLLVVLSIVSGFAALIAVARRKPVDQVYTDFRRSLTHSVLIGLEMLVIADIIATIPVELSISSLLALGLLVLIRTFLSFSLTTEIEGAWPWTLKRIRGDANKSEMQTSSSTDAARGRSLRLPGERLA